MTVAVIALRILLALGFVGMGINHFLPRSVRVMAAMIPPALRGRRITPRMLVWFTGVCEIAGGIGLLLPQTRLAAGLALVVFLIAVFPANAFAARHRDRFGVLAVPLVPRLIGQVVLALLVLVATFL
ncbi:DoxX family membrane protein [uncultured Microbacterium sp.]|uniref:DoxX family protein n=1 Tax=uncultured Microbacterium sp. TaxID=191216 RepID=UPI0025DFD55C|nr:DoxX family protein [uncultured Microbacterium sp.]